MAYPSQNISTTAYTKLQFNQVDRNDGQGYDVSTGVFSAPVAGMYHFYWSLLSRRGKHCTMFFILNGTKRVYSHTTDTTDSSISGSIYLRLKVGDQAFLQSRDNGGNIHQGWWSTFGGELIRH